MRLSILAILFCVVSTGLAFQPSVASFVFRGSIINRKPTFTAADFPPHHNTRTTVISATTDSEEWTKKRLHNTNWFRSAAVLLALGVVGVAQEQSPVVAVRAGAAIHLLAFGTWFGTIFYTTFILGLTMFKHLPRQTFGKLQSKLFPKYFSLCSTTIMLQIVTLRSLPLAITNRVIACLGGALFATLFNQFYLEPYSTKIMFERYDLENEEGGQDTDRYKELKATFGKMHGISSLSNLLALCGAVAYGFILSSLLLA